MGQKGVKRIAFVVSFICLLQLVLPMLLSLSRVVIREYQETIISRHLSEKSYFTRIELPDGSQPHVRDQREIVINGTMYDIASVCEENGKTVVYALADGRETIAWQMQDNSETKKSSLVQTFRYFTFFFTEAYAQWSIQPLSLLSKDYPQLTLLLSWAEKTISTPPPQV